MTYTFIVNPRAGRGRYRGVESPLVRAVRRVGLDAHFEYTERRGHAAEIATAARTDVIVAVGGDGTIHEVVSGLIGSGWNAHLGVVPAGTGNDFAKMFDLPTGLDRLIDVLHQTPPQRIDCGRVAWNGEENDGSAIFANVAGVGIDAKVAATAARFKMLSGTTRYLAAVMRTLRTWESPHLRVSLHRGGREIMRLEEPVLLALVGNGSCAAGGFYLTPSASLVDGVLDACLVRRTSLGRILSLIPLVIRGGRHADEPEVTLCQVDAVEVTSAIPLPVQADGEVISALATEIRFEVAAGALSVVMPVKS